MGHRHMKETRKHEESFIKTEERCFQLVHNFYIPTIKQVIAFIIIEVTSK